MKKKISKTKKSIILIRTQETLKKYLKDAAKAEGFNTLSSWMIFALSRAAQGVLGYQLNDKPTEERLLK